MDRDAYVVCVLEQLFRALKRRDIFASPSHRWSDPRARLLQGKGWEAVREDVLAGLSLDEDAEQHLGELIEVLDATWKQMAERLEEAGSDAKISIEVQPNGRAKLNVHLPSHRDVVDGAVSRMVPACGRRLAALPCSGLALSLHFRGQGG